MAKVNPKNLKWLVMRRIASDLPALGAPELAYVAALVAERQAQVAAGVKPELPAAAEPAGARLLFADGEGA